MPITERDSNIHAFLNFRTRASVLTDSLILAQREQYDLHGLQYSLLEMQAYNWRETGARGLSHNKPDNPDKREILDHTDLSSPEGYMRFAATEEHRADRGAVLLGNVALALYGVKRDGVFSAYKFATRYNNDMYGADCPTIPALRIDTPDTALSETHKAALEVSFTKDPTGADALQNPVLWPYALVFAVLDVEPETIREDMQKQIPLYKRFARRVLSENPEGAEPYNPHSNIQLEPGIQRDILFSLGSF